MTLNSRTVLVIFVDNSRSLTAREILKGKKLFYCVFLSSGPIDMVLICSEEVVNSPSLIYNRLLDIVC